MIYNRNNNKKIYLIIFSDPELLSIQQLTKAIEVYPPAPIPTPQQKLDFASAESKNGKLWNYHSDVPHINQLGNFFFPEDRSVKISNKYNIKHDFFKSSANGNKMSNNICLRY